MKAPIPGYVVVRGLVKLTRMIFVKMFFEVWIRPGEGTRGYKPSVRVGCLLTNCWAPEV